MLNFSCALSWQGLMFGYATDESEECMPLTVVLAHKLNAKMAELRRNGTLPWLRPDSKTQVVLSYVLVANMNGFFFFLKDLAHVYFYYHRLLCSTARTVVPCSQCVCTQLWSLFSMMRIFAWRRWGMHWRKKSSRLLFPASIWMMTRSTTYSPVGDLLLEAHR